MKPAKRKPEVTASVVAEQSNAAAVSRELWKGLVRFNREQAGPLRYKRTVLSMRDGGGMAPGMEAPIYWNWLAMMCLATIFVLVRMRQEETSREIDSLRRLAHSY